MKGLRLLGIAGGTAALCALLASTVPAGDRPLPVSPGSGAGTLVTSACPTLSWGSVSGAESYDLVAYRVPARTSLATSPAELTELWRVTLPGTAHSWTPDAGHCFSHGGRFAWAVRAVAGGQAGQWSEANLFSVERAPSAAEVRRMLSALRQYLDGTARRSTQGESAGQLASGTEHKADGSRGKNGGPGLRSLSATGYAPSLGAPSLSLSANLELDPASNLFKGTALFLWDDGQGNLALGRQALANNTAGSNNTALGRAALLFNTEGYSNTAVGYLAMEKNTSGYRSTAVGHGALSQNTTGIENTAVGFAALGANSTGHYNTAVGKNAMIENISGTFETALGWGALAYNTTGIHNIAIGDRAGQDISSSSSNNILIGNTGKVGDSGTIKIGTEGNQTTAFIAGIHGVTTGETGSTVVVDGYGQLGTVSSSRRVKQDIDDMGEATDGLYALRPVTFRYRKRVEKARAEGKDPSTLPHEYGLIAEEVAKIFPDLVVRDKQGRPQTVLYRFLAPMLLNELQKQHWTVIGQAKELAQEKAKVAGLEA
ncbi:MAG TPA: tail fiber domain-containing protein, partial [Thermoanaerobaculia bacterium]|nr:tail fiber domain-containing protein [Thermoanaerobaculia bacterium]